MKRTSWVDVQSAIRTAEQARSAIRSAALDYFLAEYNEIKEHSSKESADRYLVRELYRASSGYSWTQAPEQEHIRRSLSELVDRYVL